MESRRSVGEDGRYGCPIEALMDAVGGKWKPVILYHLMGGTRRFGELRRLVPGVSQRMLTQHLRELEADGIVHREVYREVPPKVEYSLTGLGRTLEPVLLKMNEWAEEHMVGRRPARTPWPPQAPGPEAPENRVGTSRSSDNASMASRAPGVRGLVDWLESQ
jgi:DNA-binding HxlR family transcriptional regulator